MHRNTLDSPHGTVDRDRHGDWLHHRWDVHRNTLDSPHGTVDRDRHMATSVGRTREYTGQSMWQLTVG